MEMETGKLFIGGISWETNEERLREHFQTYGEVVEAVIMKDRATSRARGFGFVVFADASIAEKVVWERHVIDGRIVEAKKAVPREDHQSFNRNSGSSQGSPIPARMKKIFVGGLASTVTEGDFKKYFEQYGTITDVVVMYDHNTHRPRGFGFITYDSEEAVEKVLFKTFHELNGKMIEVKRAVPKELSPGPTRSLSGGHGLNRVSSFLSPYNHGYNSSSYGMRMGGRFSPANVGRSEYSPYSPSNYTTGLNLESVFGSDMGYGHGMNNSYYSIYDGTAARIRASLNTTKQNLWGRGSLDYGPNSVSSNGFLGSRSANPGIVSNLGRIGDIWGSTPMGENGSLSARNIGYVNNRENIFGGRTDYGRNNGGVAALPSYSAANGICDLGLENSYGDTSFYSDHTWGSSFSKIEGSASDVTPNNAVDYVGNYGVNASSNRGIAA